MYNRLHFIPISCQRHPQPSNANLCPSRASFHFILMLLLLCIMTNVGGLNSGFMIAHCTAAALVSENKTLCHPASVDSLSTSAAQEDHVSMGGFAARKALDVVRHVGMSFYSIVSPR